MNIQWRCEFDRPSKLAHSFRNPEPFPKLPSPQTSAGFFLRRSAARGIPSRVTLYLIAAAQAYLLGSIPWGFLAGRMQGVDLRQQGSGSTGATNALRILGKKWGYTVFALDAFKGWLAVMVAFLVALKAYDAPQAVVINAGVVGAIFAMIGHTYPVWLRFQGGKGIATAAGIMLALFPPPVFAFGLLVWLILFYSTRYVSVASLGAAVALPTGAAGMWALGQGDPLRTGIAAVMCVLAIWRHKSNISRLLAGTEKRFEKKLRSVS
jgi:glycerol-3-phosphate acyltransferase PlsY